MSPEPHKVNDETVTELELEMLELQKKLDDLGLHLSAAHVDVAIQRLRESP